METKIEQIDLRKKWQETKKLLSEEKITELQAVIREHGLSVSPYSYYYTLIRMRKLNFDGIPYVDCKTLRGWNDIGFRVKKGQHSLIHGITWITPMYKDKDSGEETFSDYAFPKEYKLFHRTQVRLTA